MIKTVGTGRALDILARHFNVQTTVASADFVPSEILFIVLQPFCLSRRNTASQEVVASETDRLLREQIEDGSEPLFSSKNS